MQNSIFCRTCNALPNEPCRTNKGRILDTFHAKRIFDWEENYYKEPTWEDPPLLTDQEGMTRDMVNGYRDIADLRNALDKLLEMGYTQLDIDAGHNNVWIRVAK